MLKNQPKQVTIEEGQIDDELEKPIKQFKNVGNPAGDSNNSAIPEVPSTHYTPSNPLPSPKPFSRTSLSTKGSSSSSYIKDEDAYPLPTDTEAQKKEEIERQNRVNEAAEQARKEQILEKFKLKISKSHSEWMADIRKARLARLSQDGKENSVLYRSLAPKPIDLGARKANEIISRQK